MNNYSYDNVFSDKEVILFVTAHPDDLDVNWGGLVALLTQDQKEVHHLLVTNGARGSRENSVSEEKLAETRKNEQLNALNVLGVPNSNFYCLNYKDGEVENSLSLIGQISGYIRKLKPQIVCTHEPDGFYFKISHGGHFVSHRDHRNTGSSVLDAVYPFSRDRSFFPEQFDTVDTTHELYDVFLTGDKEVNTKINVSDVIEQKKKALLSHKTQFSEQQVTEIIKMFREEEGYIESGNYIKLSW